METNVYIGAVINRRCYMKEAGCIFAVVVALLTLCFSERIQAQGTLKTVAFDGPPLIAPSDEFAISYYSENGMVFTPIGPGQFGRSGGQPALTAFPRNGTAYLFASFTYSLAVTASSGKPFGLVSVQLAEFSTLYQTPLMVQFVGYRPDGTTVTNEFVTDGIIDGAGPQDDFETFYFDSQFAALTRVEVPTYRWSLDNLRVSLNVPEPGTAPLALLGLCVWQFFRKHSAPCRPRVRNRRS